MSLVEYVMLVAWFFGESYQDNSIKGDLFSKNEIGKYPTDNLLWDKESKSRLKCAYICCLDTECVSFLYDEEHRKCYGCSMRMHDLITKTTSVAEGKYYVLNDNVEDWTLELSTGNTESDAYVYVTIYGTRGASKKVSIDTPDFNDFAPNSVVKYKIVVSNFGTPLKIKVFQGQDKGDGYILIVKKLVLYGPAGSKYTFSNKVTLTENSPTAVLDRDSA